MCESDIQDGGLNPGSEQHWPRMPGTGFGREPLALDPPIVHCFRLREL